MTSLPYAGTQGWSGTDTSRERAENDVKEGKANARQRWAMARMALAGSVGITVAELREATNWHHGIASSVLTALHKDERIVRLKERRDRCLVYVLPEYQDDRETSVYHPNKKYPHQSGDVTVIGPECFTDGVVICYKGENYVRQVFQ